MTTHKHRTHRRLARPTAEGCVLDLLFAEGTATTAHDRSNKANNADVILESGQSQQSFWVDGLWGYAANLEPSDALQVPYDSSLDLGTDFTIETVISRPDWESWMTSGDTDWLIGRDGSSPYSMYIQTNSGGIKFEAGFDSGGGSVGISTNGLQDGELLHVVIRYENGQLEAFGNGARLDGNASMTGAVNTSSDPVTVGAREVGTGGSGVSTWDGKIHVFRMFNRGLSDLEILGASSHAIQRGLIRGKTRWFDANWNEQAAVDPEHGTRKLPVLSSPPSNPEPGEEYIDDGTNTSSGNLAKRIYDGASWIDQN